MSFERPAFLWLLLLIPIELCISFVRLPGLKASFSLLAGPRRGQKAAVRYRAASLCGIAASVLFLLSACLGLAGAAWDTRAVSTESSGLEIALVFDVSRSMQIKEGGSTRLDTAKRLARQLRAAAPGGAAFSLTAAKGDAVLLVPMTTDSDALDSAFDYANPDSLTSRGSGLESGISTALASFPRADRSSRLIVLFSDGGGPSGRTEKAAMQASEQGVRIWTVGIGGDSALPVPGPAGSAIVDSSGRAVHSALNAGPLKRMAALTRGRYFAASDPSAPAALREELAQLGTGGRRTVYEIKSRSGLFAGLALLFLCIRIAASLLAQKEPE